MGFNFRIFVEFRDLNPKKIHFLKFFKKNTQQKNLAT